MQEGFANDLQRNSFLIFFLDYVSQNMPGHRVAFFLDRRRGLTDKDCSLLSAFLGVSDDIVFQYKPQCVAFDEKSVSAVILNCIVNKGIAVG
jgi:hypothetical protein